MLENKYKDMENKPNIDIVTDSRKVIEKLKTKSSQSLMILFIRFKNA